MNPIFAFGVRAFSASDILNLQYPQNMEYIKDTWDLNICKKVKYYKTFELFHLFAGHRISDSIPSVATVLKGKIKLPN